MNILVTGSNGQLGSEIRELSSEYTGLNFFFTDVDTLDICDKVALNTYVKNNNINLIINCAAYTAVDKAEDDVELCEKINTFAVKNIAEVAKENKLKVIHVSTDYVFDGTAHVPYTEDCKTNPTSVYGKTKLAGEKALLSTNKKSIIIRTAWLYSAYGNNFVKTMLRLGKEKDSLNVIFDQVGTPTYARDLAKTILYITDNTSVNTDFFQPGIYHFSNEGVCSWYDFTVAILRHAGIKTPVYPIETKDYPTKATRPHYSVLNKSKIKNTFNVEIPHWENSLVDVLKRLKG